MQLNWNQIIALPTVGAVFGVFTFFVKQMFFQIFCKKNVIHFFMSKNGPERMSGSSQTYLFNSNYNIDPSTMVIRHFKNMRFVC